MNEKIEKTMYQAWEFTIWFSAKHMKEFLKYRKEFEEDVEKCV